jgi:hypothetical protein
MGQGPTFTREWLALVAEPYDHEVDWRVPPLKGVAFYNHNEVFQVLGGHAPRVFHSADKTT